MKPSQEHMEKITDTYSIQHYPDSEYWFVWGPDMDGRFCRMIQCRSHLSALNRIKILPEREVKDVD